MRVPISVGAGPRAAAAPCCPARRAASVHAFLVLSAGASRCPEGSAFAAASSAEVIFATASSRFAFGMPSHCKMWSPSSGPCAWQSGQIIPCCRRSFDRSRRALPVVVGSVTPCLGIAPGVAPAGRPCVCVTSMATRASQCPCDCLGRCARIWRVMPSTMRLLSDRSAAMQVYCWLPTSHVPSCGVG